MRALLLPALLAACTNQPQYVTCPAMPGAAPNDLCVIATADDGMGMLFAAGSLHVPVQPEADWKASDRQQRTILQEDVDPSGAIAVPIYRLEHYDLSVEWTVRNLEDLPGMFHVSLNGANEEAAYDPAMIMLGDEDDPPAPPLAGNIPTDIGPGGTIEGVFREDQLAEAAIDLDQITRGNVNPFAATLTISRHAASFQPVTAYDPLTETGGDPVGAAIPAAAFRQLVRVDMTIAATRMMELEYTIRIREHVQVVHDEGLSAPAAELDLRDPPFYSASLP